jgi:hypothetical protein
MMRVMIIFEIFTLFIKKEKGGQPGGPLPGLVPELAHWPALP